MRSQHITRSNKGAVFEIELEIMKRILILFLISPTLLFSQDSIVMSYDDFIDQVKSFHPVIRQLQLLDIKSDGYTLKAKGNFDPTIDFNIDNKSFDDKRYYRKMEGQIKIPTKYGLAFEGGYERNNGDFLNDENSLPLPGLISAGVRIPLANGLLYDERRMILDEAKIIVKENRLKQIEKYNKVIFDATKSYINWQTTYQKILIYTQAISVAEQTYGNTKDLYIQGVGTGIDTLEAELNLDQRNSALLKLQQDYNLARQAINNYIWDANQAPLELNNDTKPEVLAIDKWQDQMFALQILQDSLLLNLTSIQNLDFEKSRYELLRKLEKENLKPTVDLKYNPLLSVNRENRLLSLAPSDYKLGVSVYYPLLTRKARGSIKIIDADIETVVLEQSYTTQRLKTALDLIKTNQEILNERFLIAEKNTTSAATLFEAETIKFNLGESSLFLLNSREQKRLEYALKSLDAQNEYLKNQTIYIYLLQGF